MVATAMPNGIEVEVVKHQKTESGYFYKHMAIIKTKVNALDSINGEDVVKATSRKVGFNTELYGIYRYNVRNHPPEDCYLISWETESNAF